MTKLFFAALIAVGAPASGSTEAAPAEPITIGEGRQLFIDRLLVKSMNGVALKVHAARKAGPILDQAAKPWERQTINWISVAEDRDTFHLWYEAWGSDGREATEHLYFLCQAVSNDGEVWQKPDLGLFPYKGSRANNILHRTFRPAGHSRFLGVTVFRDPSAPDAERFKAVYQGEYSTFPPRKVSGMTSPDGLRWTVLRSEICDTVMDGQYSCFWDERTRTYALYGLAEAGRSIRRAESADFKNFPQMKLILDVEDAGLGGSEFYSPVVMKYAHAEDVYLMFVSVHDHKRRWDTRLAVSRDGIHWTFPERDAPVLEQGPPGSFDSGTLSVAQGMIRVGSELWQYYAATPLDETGNPSLEFPASEEFASAFTQMDRRLRHRSLRFGRMISRIDGFVSLQAGNAGGHFITPSLLFDGDALHVNAKVAPGGQLRVALLDERGREIRGRESAACIPIEGDQTDAEVRWESGADVADRQGKPTALRFEMSGADLFSFQIKKSVFIK